jgi:hypothetical protein
VKKKLSNIERFHHANPDARRNAHGTRSFTLAMWDHWRVAREPDHKTGQLRDGIDEFRGLLERRADSIKD